MPVRAVVWKHRLIMAKIALPARSASRESSFAGNGRDTIYPARCLVDAHSSKADIPGGAGLTAFSAGFLHGYH
jgi:hypothetical protein